MRRPSRRRIIGALALLALTGAIAACSSGGDTSVDRTIPTVESVPTSPITVFAASSLTEAFNSLAQAFQAAQNGASVAIAIGGGGELADQIVAGGAADVFASADRGSMATVVTAGLAQGEPVVFAKATMQIVVAPGNPKGITSLADLATPGLKVVLGGDDTPTGAYASTVLRQAGVSVTPVSTETLTKVIVAKVASGDADAGIVFTTDVIAAGSTVTGVDIPSGVNVTAEFVMVATTTSGNRPTSSAFMDFVRSPKGQEILTAAGFLPA